VPVCAVGTETEQLEDLRKHGITTVSGDPGQRDVLMAAGLAEARIIVITDALLPDKMRTCIAAREINPRIAIVATATGGTDRAWLHEFGVAYICDALDEMTEALLRSIRSGL
jgi:CPA2 family monovalent cation:H+ antiporter-2